MISNKRDFFFFDVMLLSRLADLLIVSTVIGKTMFERMNSLNLLLDKNELK